MKSLSCLFAWAVFYGVALAADGNSDIVGPAEIRAAVQKTVEKQCKAIEEEISNAEKKLKVKAASPEQRREKILIKNQISSAKKYLASLRSGKAVPQWQSLAVFSLHPGDIGTLSKPPGNNSWPLEVLGQVERGTVVRARVARFSGGGGSFGGSGTFSGQQLSMSGGGGGGRFIGYDYGQQFLLIGQSGATEEVITVPKETVWIVMREKSMLVLYPVSKDMLGAK